MSHENAALTPRQRLRLAQQVVDEDWSVPAGIARRSDKTARNYHAGICSAAALRWLDSRISNTP